MYTHSAEIVAKARFHESAGVGVEWLTWGTQYGLEQGVNGQLVPSSSQSQSIILRVGCGGVCLT
jgi:hypothetical protein